MSAYHVPLWAPDTPYIPYMWEWGVVRYELSMPRPLFQLTVLPPKRPGLVLEWRHVDAKLRRMGLRRTE